MRRQGTGDGNLRVGRMDYVASTVSIEGVYQGPLRCDEAKIVHINNSSFRGGPLRKGKHHRELGRQDARQ